MRKKKKKSPDLTPKVKSKYPLVLGLLLGVFLLIVAVGAYVTINPTFNTGTVKIEDSLLHVELAKTPGEHKHGLMYRTTLAGDQGMLFILSQTQISCMWMKNTKIPLAVAFANEKGEILNIEKMAPDTEDNHCSVSPAKYALETNPDWFDIHKIKPGMLLTYTEPTK